MGDTWAENRKELRRLLDAEQAERRRTSVAYTTRLAQEFEVEISKLRNKTRLGPDDQSHEQPPESSPKANQWLKDRATRYSLEKSNIYEFLELAVAGLAAFRRRFVKVPKRLGHDLLVAVTVGVTLVSGTYFVETRRDERIQIEADIREFQIAFAQEPPAGAKLPGFSLPGLVAFERNFSGTDLSQVDLSDAKLSRTVLVEAKLTDANLANADLRDAEIRYADLTRANLSGADLRGADLSNAVLMAMNLTQADLRSATVSGIADLSTITLQGADMYGLDLAGKDLSGANLRQANLSNANLARASLIGADLSQEILTDATLSGADLTGADLSQAILTGAKLDGAILIEANFYLADLTKATLVGANLANAALAEGNLTQVNLSRSNLTGVDLRGKNLALVQLEGVAWDPCATMPIWPSGYEPPLNSWPQWLRDHETSDASVATKC